ncbi:protein kinase [Nonomuraea sp. N2-4H]|uniref:serine/threonine-protein kinase n=1 Tax=Nonomuraea sp. N2-4H TaxID=3128898 RepID=UPI0032525C59
MHVSNRYRLLEPIGEGGMGVVWRAYDELLDRTVAIKEVRYTGVGDAKRAELNRRTIREARAAGRLDHPSVIVIHDVVEEDGRPWIVMQLVRSRSLARVISEDGPLRPEQAAVIGGRVLDALRAAHATGVLHRDVKPENVLLADDGRVVLTDFGIAALETEGGLTATGGLVGTPAYMPPERLNGEPARPESDLWSLGATLYAAVEGRPPFKRDSWAATVAAVLRDDPEPPARAGALGPIVMGLLRREPEARLPAAEAARLLYDVAATAPPRPAATADAPWQAPAGSPSPEGSWRATSPQEGSWRGTPPPNASQRDTPPPDGTWPATPPPGASRPDTPPADGSWRATPPPGASRPDTPPAVPADGGTPPPDASWHQTPRSAHDGIPTGGRPDATLDGRGGGRRKAMLIALPAAVLAVAALGGGGVLLYDRLTGTAAAPRPSPTPAPTEQPTEQPAEQPAEQPSKEPSKEPSQENVTTAPTTGVPTREATEEPAVKPTEEPVDEPEIPDGWRAYRNTAGRFQIAVPPRWRATKTAGRDSVEFTRPGTPGRLLVEWTIPDVPWKDPERHWVLLEAEIRRKGDFEQYRRIAITPTEFQGRPAADWEFTRVDQGVTIHVIDRGLRTAEGRPFAVMWETTQDRWERDRHYFDDFLRTFRPL